MKVFILASKHTEDDFSNLHCVLKSIRVGFPNAEVNLYMNGRSCCFSCDVVNTITILPSVYAHDEFIEYIFNKCQGYHDKIVFVDPDMIFYEEVENKLNDIPEHIYLAGRYVPPYFNEVVGANECERFHTSLLVMNRLDRIEHLISSVGATRNFPFNAFSPFQYILNTHRYFHDTCANLYHLIPHKHKHRFSTDFLDKYTHLVSGTMLDLVASRIHNGERLRWIHEQAKTNPEKFKGLWKEHDEFYANHPVQTF